MKKTNLMTGILTLTLTATMFSAIPVCAATGPSTTAHQAVDATQGRKTKGVIITDTERIVLSALLPETIAVRCRESGS